jgi:hypothetical protein
MPALARRLNWKPARSAAPPALALAAAAILMGAGTPPPAGDPPRPAPAVKAVAVSNADGRTPRSAADLLKPDMLPPRPADEVTSPASAGSPADASAHALTMLGRVYAQDQGAWHVDYRLRIDGPHGLILTPSEVTARVEGWVSNSRVAGHSTPRFSSATLSGPAAAAGLADVIHGAEEAGRCRERLIIQVWPEGRPPVAPPDAHAAHRPLLSLAPGSVLCVRLRLEHEHVVFGDYDPLLGPRTLDLQVGPVALRDDLPLDHEQYRSQAQGTWTEPPAERLDARMAVSGPDSLHLQAHVPGNHYFRFRERPVRYDTRMRLTYWYAVAPGTEGECRARIAQYKETKSSWKVLPDGSHEQVLATVGRWVKVERTFRTERDATTLALDFSLTGSEVGEAWVDDVRLELADALAVGP